MLGRFREMVWRERAIDEEIFNRRNSSSMCSSRQNATPKLDEGR